MSMKHTDMDVRPQDVRCKVLRRAAVVACATGWSLRYTKGGHLQWRSPDGAHLILTGVDPHRDKKRDLARLRRAGLEV